MDWNEEVHLNDFTISTTPARHFSGRNFKRNTSLWLSFVLNISGKKIFIGGDSGYDTHFKTIGEKFGPSIWSFWNADNIIATGSIFI